MKESSARKAARDHVRTSKARERGIVRAPKTTRKRGTPRASLALLTLIMSACDVTPTWTGPRTEAESSNHERTSTSEQVREFVSACAAHSPLLRVETIGSTTGKRPLDLVLAADPPVASVAAAKADARIKVLVMANIHAGEVEGKEASLAILREIAQGGHRDIVTRLIVAFIPNYNPDGNDKIDRRHRPDQAGPIQGVGVRHNGMDLDLNRDYVKAEAPETEALIRTVRGLDAALVVDLHTTNGSFHGFDLTYAGPLHPATDPGVLKYVRASFLPALQARMRKRGFETFDYGNWVDEKDPASGWASFEGLPRYGNSYFGLRNRLTLLSEAYSHDPFDKRIAKTHALVTGALAIAAEESGTIRSVIAAADRAAATLAGSASLPTRTRLEKTFDAHPIPVGSVREEKDPVTGLVRQWDTDQSAPVTMPVFAHFSGTDPRPVPSGWIVPRPGARMLRVLAIHGIESVEMDRERTAKVEIFRIAGVSATSLPFQGHKQKRLRGAHEPAEVKVPKGAIYIPGAQPMARLAFVLLEPESEDGLATWGLAPTEPDGAGGEIFVIERHVAWIGG